MTKKITYGEFLALLRDIGVPDSQIAPHVILVPGETGLDFEVRPNPETVEMTAEDERLENALKIGNGIARFRRRNRFFKTLQTHPDRTVLVSEGDSWFQFPFLIDETIDQLLPHYNILSLGAAGATLEEMTQGRMRPRGVEYLLELRRHKDRVRAFLFSGAGNDIIGEHPDTGRPMLTDLLRDYNGNAEDTVGHIDDAAVTQRIAMLAAGYRGVIAAIRGEPGFESLPIVFHGYDYAYPYPFGSDDRRNPSYAANDKWLGSAFAARGINAPTLRRAIIVDLIDRLYRMLHDLRAGSAGKDIYVVDCRGALPDVADWNDEIHGTSEGYVEVGRRFHETIRGAIAAEMSGGRVG